MTANDDAPLAFGQEVLWRAARGPVLRLSFSGVYPPGSAGNPAATAVREFVTQALAPEPPAAVLYDLSGLDYRAGDALLPGLVLPLLRLAGWTELPPLCFAAAGETAAALGSLLAFAGWRRLFDPPILGGVAEGADFLRELAPPTI